MLTGTHQRLALVDSFTVRAGDTVPSRVYPKYLGVMVDPYLSWNDHIDYIGRKISAKLGMLRKVRKVIPRESCLTLNNAMKLPVFDYCAVVWYSCSKADWEYLDKPHRRAANIIEGYTVSTLSVGLRSIPAGTIQPRLQGFSLTIKKWVGREKALASAGHVYSLNILEKLIYMQPAGFALTEVERSNNGK